MVSGPGCVAATLPLAAPVWCVLQVIEALPPVEPRAADPSLVASAERHPMRRVAYAAAAEVGAWSGGLPGEVTAVFDGLAGEWHAKMTPDRLAALDDALVRGGADAAGAGVWLELGCGDGGATATVAARADRLLAMDLSPRMLAAARARGTGVPLVRADAAALPLADHAVAVAVLMNMLLFPTELDRILQPGGRLVWVSSRGPATPIFLSASQVVAALPGRWGGVASQHGEATWAVLRRLG